jgi:hypothetical protein
MHKPGDFIFMLVIMFLGLGLGAFVIDRVPMLQEWPLVIQVGGVLILTALLFVIIVLLINGIVWLLKKVSQGGES